MAIRNVVQVGDETLRKISFPVIEFNDNLKTLLDDMKETLVKEDGVGLAAPQVGVLRRVFILLVDDKYYECVNPKIVSFSGSQIGTEGCLSVKGKMGEVERPMNVTLKAYDRNGKAFTVKASGLLARAIFHENDHLDGILYIDKANYVKG